MRDIDGRDSLATIRQTLKVPTHLSILLLAGPRQNGSEAIHIKTETYRWRLIETSLIETQQVLEVGVVIPGVCQLRSVLALMSRRSQTPLRIVVPTNGLPTQYTGPSSSDV